MLLHEAAEAPPATAAALLNSFPPRSRLLMDRFPFDSLRLMFDVSSQTAAEAKSRIWSLLCFLLVVADTSPEQTKEVWWPLKEGAGTSGGQYVLPSHHFAPALLLFARPYLTFQPLHYSWAFSVS